MKYYEIVAHTYIGNNQYRKDTIVFSSKNEVKQIAFKELKTRPKGKEIIKLTPTNPQE